MVAATRTPARARTWLSIREASLLLGVSPATLRRWAEAGAIRTFTTPGGHRRFDRAAVLAMLPAMRRQRPRLVQLGESLERVVARYRRELGAPAGAAPWITRLSDDEREPFREHGRAIVAALLALFDSTTDDERRAALATAETEAANNARLALDRRIGLGHAIDIFLRFRRPFLVELVDLARRRHLDTAEATSLVVEATDAFDGMLRALTATYEARGRRPGTTDIAAPPGRNEAGA